MHNFTRTVLSAPHTDIAAFCFFVSCFLSMLSVTRLCNLCCPLSFFPHFLFSRLTVWVHKGSIKTSIYL